MCYNLCHYVQPLTTLVLARWHHKSTAFMDMPSRHNFLHWDDNWYMGPSASNGSQAFLTYTKFFWHTSGVRLLGYACPTIHRTQMVLNPRKSMCTQKASTLPHCHINLYTIYNTIKPHKTNPIFFVHYDSGIKPHFQLSTFNIEFSYLIDWKDNINT